KSLRGRQTFSISCTDFFRSSRKVGANQTMERTIPLVFTIDESFDIRADTGPFQLHRQDRLLPSSVHNSRPRMYKNWSRQRSVPRRIRTGLPAVPLTRTFEHPFSTTARVGG